MHRRGASCRPCARRGGVVIFWSLLTARMLFIHRRHLRGYDRAAAALTRYRELVQADHGRLNLPKSIIWSPTAASTQHPDILALAGVRATPDAALTGGFDVRGPDGGLRVLGHPLGADGYCRDFYMEKSCLTGRPCCRSRSMTTFFMRSRRLLRTTTVVSGGPQIKFVTVAFERRRRRSRGQRN